MAKVIRQVNYVLALGVMREHEILQYRNRRAF